MRIALVSSHIGTTSRGTAVTELARALVHSGHDAVVYTRRDATHLAERELTPDGYELVRVTLGPARPMSEDAAWSYTNELSRYLNSEWEARSPDIVHTHGTMAGLAALLAAREYKIPVVHTHDEPAPERERVERLVSRHAAHVVATSNDQVTGLCRMGVPRTRITVVPAGVDVDDQEAAGAAERCPGLVSLLGLGELRSGHGFDTVVAAMAEVRDARLVIAAPVETLDRKTSHEAKRLREFAAQHAVGDRVSVVATATPSDVTGLLRSADLVVTTPRQDPSGVFALQAMVHGLPVVASDVGALADAVVDGITGRLVPPGDVPALAVNLRELVAEPAKREAFGIAGADRVRARYGWDRVVTDTVRVYQRAQLVHA